MYAKTLIVLAILSAALAAPASAQYRRVGGPGYHGGYYGPAYGTYGPAYGPPAFSGAYGPPIAGAPFYYGDGWVPESIFDHSRVGGVDPTIRPPAN